MLDFDALRKGETTLTELVEGLDPGDLRGLTGEMVDRFLALIAGCTDEDVVFQPTDPDAYDPYTTRQDEVAMPWTLGHVIVHTTASAEEAAFLAAEMARGVKNHGRSRYEIPWQTVTTIDACRRRLEESRRMRLASLEMWPDPPHLEISHVAWKGGPRVNAVGRFVLGLKHASDHLGQVAEIVRQAGHARRSKIPHR